MSVGKDVSALFADVINCVQSNSIEIKKLVYLYVVNYAKVQPELAILAVNTFRKDSLDPNPLIRALAVRTMGYIRLEAVVEYLTDPIRRCCRDPDAYVRKTAAMSIAKLYYIAPTLVEEQGFLDILQNELLADANPMVVANSAAALMEISNASGRNQFDSSSIDAANVLLNALNECTEWAQVSLLDALALFKPVDTKDARIVVERVCARLSHSNAAVVLGALKVVVNLLDRLGSPDAVRTTCKKLSGPLITLLAESEPEIQYIALRNISILTLKYPAILAGEVKVFFCKYNDPVYVKLEKLEAMVQLIQVSNADQVLNELKEYSSEVDVEFVRKAVRCIGRCAIRLESAADKCVSALLELIESKISYVVQEAVVVMRDIFRRFPNRYESVISALCDNLESLDEPEAKSAMIWILGEYSDRIDNSQELLDSFLTNFFDEPSLVQLSLLTASVKLFLKLKNASHSSLVKIFDNCTSQNENPDLRDRAFLYWRLLAADPELCRQCVVGPKPLIVDDVGNTIEPEIIQKLIHHIGTLASVYHMVPNSFVSSSLIGETADSDEEGRTENVKRIREVLAVPKVSLDSREEDEEEDEEESDSEEDSEDSESDSEDLAVHGPKIVLLPATAVAGAKKTSGLQIEGSLGKLGKQPCLFLTITNRTLSPLSQWAIQFNKNSFGIAPLHAAFSVGGSNNTLGPNVAVDVSIPLEYGKLNSGTPPSILSLQIALKNNLDIFYFVAPFDLSVVIKKVNMDDSSWIQSWDALASSEQVGSGSSAEKILKSGFVQVSPTMFACTTCNKLLILAKLVGTQVAVRSVNVHVVKHALTSIGK